MSSRVFVCTFFVIYSFVLFGQQSQGFIENKGQVYDQDGNPNADVLFYSSTLDYSVQLNRSGMSFQIFEYDIKNVDKESEINGPTQLKPEYKVNIYRTDLILNDMNSRFKIKRGKRQNIHRNFYFDHCPKGITDVPSYESILIEDCYDGIDLNYYYNEGEIEYDFILRPGSQPDRIKWKAEGVEISINSNGDLLLRNPLGDIIQSRPIAIQNGRNIEVKWKIDDKGFLGYELESYDPEQMLIIDPIIRKWATYYGGNGLEDVYGGMTTLGGTSYFVGSTTTLLNMATTGAHQTTLGGSRDALISSFSNSGGLVWSTYYGGSSADVAYDSDIDDFGNIYLIGHTTSNSAIATSGSHLSTFAGNVDAFLVKFSASGIRQWGTYFGGTGQDYGLGCTLDDSANVFITGRTASTNGIATSGCHQNSNGGGSAGDAFLAKFSSSGSLKWSTYYGGNDNDGSLSLQIDSAGNVIMSGYTWSNNGIATSGSYNASRNGGEDGFIAKFNSSGSRLWATYLGGTLDDHLIRCATDDSGYVYVTGHTRSTNGISTSGSHQSSLGGNRDAFVMKFDAVGNHQWGTYLGGMGDDIGRNIRVAHDGNVLLCGYTSSSSGIASANAYKSINSGGSNDAFYTILDQAGNVFTSSYYGGTGDDRGIVCQKDFLERFIFLDIRIRTMAFPIMEIIKPPLAVVMTLFY